MSANLPMLALIADAGGQSVATDIQSAIAGASSSGRIVQMVALLSVLSIAPSILIMTTSFTRVIVALSFLRSGLGMQSTPANLLMTSLALFMTYFIMAPTFERAWTDGVAPLVESRITDREAIDRIVQPFRAFMSRNVRDKDLLLFEQLASKSQETAAADTVELRILVPAFMISELRRGFEIGFMIALPFLVIDLVVATITMSMGMMMLPPSVIALPVKVLFFVLIDGWSLLVGSIVRSYGAS
ncbi:MAG: flagellar type III secretion system pore protein FliP [Hyphomicrobiales bacterium]|nr:flagellar type III secretion system pore protein FliP [Hyphomicrobiales bacterium]